MTPAVAVFVFFAVASLVVAAFVWRRLIRRGVISARLTSQHELRQRFAEADRLVSGTTHDELASLVRSLEDARALLDRSGDPSSARVSATVSDVLEVCDRIRSETRSSIYPDSEVPSEGAMSSLMDRWGRTEKAPVWWPQTLREIWAISLGAWLDSIRQLHTREIERLALAGTLILRAAIMLAALVAGSLMIAGVAPFTDSASTAGNVAWALCTTWALLLAAGSAWLVNRVLDVGRRWLRVALALVDGGLAVFLLLALPSWLDFAFLAGSFNWLMRPTWRFRKLSVCLAISVALLVVGLQLHGEPSLAQVAAEIVVGVALLGLISNSYGLMLPVVVGHVFFVMPSWYLATRRFERRRWQTRAQSLTHALAAAAATASQEAAAGSPAVAEVEPRLEAARRHVEALSASPHRSRTQLLRRRTLGEVVGEGLGDAVNDPDTSVRLASPTYAPPSLHDRRVRSWLNANHLEIALRRIGYEAIRHGDFEIRCAFVLLSDGDVHVRIENDLPVGADLTPRRVGRGAREIAAAVDQLPHSDLILRGFEQSALGLPIFAVEFTFSSDMLAAVPR